MPSDYLEPEFAKPFNMWKADPSPMNSDALLKAVNPAITASLRGYSAREYSPTLYSKAKLMALDAMGRYDPTKAKLRTHLMVQLQGLRRLHAKENQILSVPEQVGLDNNKLREAENFLRDQYGRDPSDREIADHTGLSIKRLGYIRKARPSYAEGSFSRQGEEGEDIYQPAIAGQNNVEHWHEFVYHDLTPIDQVIMEYTLGLHGKKVLSNQDIAKKLGISPGAVSQRKARIQAKLDLRDTLGVI